MSAKSSYNGNGNSYANGPDMRSGSPVPPYMRIPAFLDARAVSTTFWELL